MHVDKFSWHVKLFSSGSQVEEEEEEEAHKVAIKMKN